MAAREEKYYQTGKIMKTKVSERINYQSACIVLCDPKTGEFLTVARLWYRCLPGGIVRDHETNIYTAIRRLGEETGVTVSAEKLTPVYVGKRDESWTTAYLGWTDSIPDFNINKYVSPEGRILKMMTAKDYLQFSGFPKYDRKLFKSIEKLLN